MQINPTAAGLFSTDATTTDPHRHGSKFQTGALVWKQVADGGVRRPITITYDDGVYYEYIEGHIALNGSNDRSRLFLNDSEAGSRNWKEMTR